MNKIQKAVVSAYVLTSFGYWLYHVFSLPGNLYGDTYVLTILGSLVTILIAFGIPTFILLVLWRNKKKELERD